MPSNRSSRRTAVTPAALAAVTALWGLAGVPSAGAAEPTDLCRDLGRVLAAASDDFYGVMRAEIWRQLAVTVYAASPAIVPDAVCAVVVRRALGVRARFYRCDLDAAGTAEAARASVDALAARFASCLVPRGYVAGVTPGEAYGVRFDGLAGRAVVAARPPDGDGAFGIGVTVYAPSSRVDLEAVTTSGPAAAVALPARMERAEPPPAGYVGSTGMAWLSLEGVVSYRDADRLGLDPGEVPDTRVAFGPEMGLLFGTIDEDLNLLVRLALGFSADWPAVGAGEPSRSPRYGGMRLEASGDLFGGIALGRATFLGGGFGWHGVSGPLTKNSSLAASVLLWQAAEHDDDAAWFLRVVPFHLIAANERLLASPLTVEARAVLGSGLGLGVELQYIAAPELGDQDIAAEGFAVILRVGVGMNGL